MSDRVGRECAWTLAAWGFLLCYLCLLALQAQPSATLLYLMVAVQGLFGYGLATVYGAIPAELFQGPKFGTIFGTLGSASILGAASSPWLTGAIYDWVGSDAPAFWLSIALGVVPIACIWLAGPRKVRVVAGQVARLQALRARQGGWAS